MRMGFAMLAAASMLTTMATASTLTIDDGLNHDSDGGSDNAAIESTDNGTVVNDDNSAATESDQVVDDGAGVDPETTNSTIVDSHVDSAE